MGFECFIHCEPLRHCALAVKCILLNREDARTREYTKKSLTSYPIPHTPHLKFIPMWQETSSGLYRKFTFNDFSAAFAFMTRVAMEAEKMNHHPRWTNVWNTVEIWLNTHDAGGAITEKDRVLSNQIDRLIGGA